MLKSCLRIFLLVFMGVVVLFAQSTRQQKLLFINQTILRAASESFQRNPQQLSLTGSTLLKNANKALKEKPASVVEKKQLPPSGDIHDYMSIAPYWWPDSTKPGGLPYIRRDGERNPERNKVGDRKNIGAMNEKVWILAMAYTISTDEKYANAAIKQLKVWFLDPKTKMNPNLNYAQSVKGQNEGRGTGIIDTHGFKDLVDAIVLLRPSANWSGKIDRDLHIWFEKYLEWLLESKNGKDECAAKNNHGSIYDVQVASIALFLGKDDLARRVLNGVGKKRIAVQIEPDGSQPLELVRTKSWGYCMLNTEALVDLAVLAKQLGIDLWRFQTEDGRSLRKAINFLIPYSLGKQTWKWKQIIPYEFERMYPVLIQAAKGLNDSTYQSTAGLLKNKFDISSSVVFTLPMN
jgi:hypothetical protein